MVIKETIIKGSTDMNLCLLADIHYYPKYRLKTFRDLLDKIKILKPDYICITGDIIDYNEILNEANMNYLYNFIMYLGLISKVIISLGNHDLETKYGSFKYPIEMINEIKKIPNVYLLDNETITFNNITFIGYTETFNIDREKGCEDIVINEVNNLLNNITDNYNILLSHNPLYLNKEEVYNKIDNFNKINLILSGHTHNGMLPNFIKTNTLLITPMKRWFKKYGRGHFIKNNTHFVVTGGVVKLSKMAYALHLFNPLFAINIDNIIIKKD